MIRIIKLNEFGRRCGESHHRSNIPDELVDLIREMHEERNKSYGQIALRFNISRSTVQKICEYKRRVYTPERFVRVSL